MAFHQYRLNELFSNADGSIQFIELTVGNFNNESFWQGQSITATQGSTVHRFNFPGNLPSTATANRSVLLATQGFANLGLVTPDFIIPAQFLFTNGGTVDFAGVSSINYASLPIDGSRSLSASNTTATNSPKNFAGITGTVVPPPVNHAPTLANALADQNAAEDSAFSYTVPAGSFADADAGDTLSYRAARADGGALPAWLGFDTGSRRFAGTPGEADIGSLTIRVTATDRSNANVGDDFVLTVANVNDAPDGIVSLGGTPLQGQILAASNTLIDADRIVGEIAYQWLTDGSPIDGATASTLQLDEALVGKSISVIASYSDAHGTAEFVASAATTPVANLNDPPTGELVLSGSAVQYQMLVATNTLDDIDGMGAISSQWQAHDGLAWQDIDGATADTLMLAQAQVGKAVRVLASYVDGHGNAETVASAETAVIANVNDAPTGSLTILGSTYVGQTLTAQNLLADLDGMGPPGYQWRADGLAIGGATGANLVLGEAQLGKSISLVVTWIDGGGNAEAVASTATDKVTRQILEGSQGNDSLVGGAGADIIKGLTGNDVLQGAAGNDTLVGGTGDDSLIGGAGNDRLFGGAGNDSYLVEDAGDRITELAGAGNDLVRSAISLILGDNLEQLILVGTADMDATGNDLANMLTGNSGNNRLDGRGGVDTLRGGAGNDIYQVDLVRNGASAEMQDVIVENPGEGSDTLSLRAAGDLGLAAATTLMLAADLENLDLTLTGSNLLNLTGNAAANILSGNAAANVLDGAAGADLLMGGAGNDTYVVREIQDQLVEMAGDGTDLALVDLVGGTYVLADQIEHGTLLGGMALGLQGNVGNNTLAGNAATNMLDGQGGDDRLSGGAGNDTLIGGADRDVLDGGTGYDVLIGGAGSDTYLLDRFTETATENPNEGVDLIRLDVPYAGSYTLAPNVENLALTGFGTISVTGNGQDNVLSGTRQFDRQRKVYIASHLDGAAGRDLLIGGNGADTLTGGSGNDRYQAGIGDRVQEGGGATAAGGIDVLELRVASLGLAAALTNAFDSFSGDLRFSRVNGGQDLRIDVAIDGGALSGAITVAGFNLAANMVETLKLHDASGTQIGASIDLASVWGATNATPRSLALSGGSTVYGALAG